MNSHRKHKIDKKVVRIKRLWRIGFAVKRSEGHKDCYRVCRNAQMDLTLKSNLPPNCFDNLDNLWRKRQQANSVYPTKMALTTYVYVSFDHRDVI